MLKDQRVPILFILHKIRWQAPLVLIYAFSLEAYFMYYHPYSTEKALIPLGVPSTLGTAISLILAFRTGQAYGRWWEARKVWGAIVNDSRTLMRQVLSFPTANALLQKAQLKALQQEIAYRQITWCHALGRSLRKQPALERSFLSDAEQTQVEKHSNIPNALLQQHSLSLKQLYETETIDSYQYTQMDDTLSRLCDAMGKSERIKNTVFPKTYSIFIEALLYLFVILLPLGLTDYLGAFIAAPMIATISIVFFLLEETAIRMQDPFENCPMDTPVTAIANTIETNLRQMLDEESVEELQTHDKSFYVL
ncbi:MAG: hypothetical protein MK212_06045 [Saprospiraceae bacterium]|nr:hypothetical protein [Saprospiraceae bacterium]